MNKGVMEKQISILMNILNANSPEKFVVLTNEIKAIKKIIKKTTAKFEILFLNQELILKSMEVNSAISQNNIVTQQLYIFELNGVIKREIINGELHIAINKDISKIESKQINMYS